MGLKAKDGQLVVIQNNRKSVLPDQIAIHALNLWGEYGPEEAMAYLSSVGYADYNINTLKRRATRYGIRKARVGRGYLRWTLREHDVIRLYYPDKDCPHNFILEKLPGRTWSQVQMQAFLLGVNRGSPPDNGGLYEDGSGLPQITVKEPVVILSDAHIPYHDPGWMERVLVLGSQWGARRVLLVGDTVDMGASAEDGRLTDALYEEEHESYLDVERRLLADYETVDIILAAYTHYRIPRRHGPGPPHVKIVERTYVANKDRVTPHDSYGFNINRGQWYVEHASGKYNFDPLKTATKRGCSAAVAHTHTSSLSRDPSGRLLGIGIGAAADHSRLPYCNRCEGTTRKDQGALILVPKRVGFYPYLLTPDMDLEEMRHMYQGRGWQ